MEEVRLERQEFQLIQFCLSNHPDAIPMKKEEKIVIKSKFKEPKLTKYELL